MAIVRERLGGDLLESVIIDPQAVKTFDVPKALLRFTDAAPMSLSPLGGLRDIGPYDTKTSDDYLRRRFDRCEVMCAYPKGRTAILRDLDKLTSYLRNGYDGTSDKDPDFPPFDKTFRLDSAVFSAGNEFVQYDLDALKPFRETILDWRQEVLHRGNRPLVLVAVESHKSIAPERDIYAPLKRLINREDIPSQFLSDYVTDQDHLGVLYYVRMNRAVGYAVWNIALDMYIKLGGVPWTVDQGRQPGDSIDITIGLRFAPYRDSQGFCLGVATVLDRFGRLIGTVPLENLEIHRAHDTPIPGMCLNVEAAQRLVTKAFDKVLEDKRTQPIMRTGKALSLVRHKLGPGTFHREEVEGVERARASKLKRHDVHIAYVPVVAGETLAAFGPSTERGAMPEGRGLKLSDNTALLYTVASDRKLTSPITVKVQNLAEPGCAFQGVEQACGHIQTLCGLHWQMVSSGKMKLPADLHFAHRIAQGFAKDIQPNPDSWLWQTQWYL